MFHEICTTDIYLIVPLILRVEFINIFISTQQTLDFVQRPPRSDLLDLLDIAVAVNRVLGVGSTSTPAVETVGVGWSLSVTEVAGMTTSPNTSGNSALLDGLADHHAVLLELLGEDRVEERVAAAVQRQDKDGENFGSLQRY